MNVVGVDVFSQVIGVMEILTLDVAVQGGVVVCATLRCSVVEWFIDYMHAVGVAEAALVQLTFVAYLLLAAAHLIKCG